MCELFAMSSSEPTDVNHSLALLGPRGGELGPHADGWGVAFFEGRAARVFKEPVPAAESRCLAFITGYDFQSTMVIAHIRRANPERVGRASANTHPFEREWNGRSWVFAHNGILPGIRDEFALGRFRPLGETDSEYAFCFLLERIAAAHPDPGPSAKTLVDIIRPVVARLAEFGEFNFVLGNGEFLLVHAHTRLSALRRTCRLDGCRLRVVLIATSPLTDEEWVALPTASLHAYVHGGELGTSISTAGASCGGPLARSTACTLLGTENCGEDLVHSQ